jgi:peptide deformylase
MSKLKIYTFPDEVLAKKAKPIQRVEKSLHKLADDMLETMYYAPGVGLAANQVGILDRILVIDTEYDVKELAEGEAPPAGVEVVNNGIITNKKPIIVINPEIIHKEGEILFCEGCLSVPEYSAEVKRAEKIKIRYGCALASLVKSDETIEVPGVGGRKPRVLARKLLAEIIEPRVEEIFSLIQHEVMKAGFQDKLSGGVVITGGTTILEGMPELAEFIFEMPVKRGYPLAIGGLRDVVNSPKFATAVGLLKYGARNLQRSKFPIREKNIYDKIRDSMRGWMKDLF